MTDTGNTALTQVSQEGFLKTGGPGTYVIEGRSNSGKNYLLDHMVTQAYHKGLTFSNVITYSGSQEENDSLNFIEKLYDSDTWAITKSLDEILYAIQMRKKHIGEMRKKIGEKDASRFKRSNPLLIVLDDFGGTVNMTTNTKNPWYNVVTTVRNLGIYLIMLIQYPKQIGPSFWNNCKLVCSFDRSEKGLKHYCSTTGMGMDKYLLKEVLDWLRDKHKYLLWWNDWTPKETLPRLPWVGYPVRMGSIPLLESLEDPPQSMEDKSESE